MENISSLCKEERCEKIIDKLINMVYEGKIKEGEKMPSENALAKNFDISRAHVREVYNALSIFGIVESRRGEGTFFKGNESNMIFQMLFLMLYNDSVTVENIMEIRKIMEIGIAEKAAMNRTEKDAEDLRKCIKKIERCNDGVQLSLLDSELHSIIGRSSGNHLLMSLSNIISGLVIRSIQEHWNYIIFDRNKATKSKTYEQHKELAESIINKKPYIAKVIAQEHLEFVTESLERYKNEYAAKKNLS